MSDTSSSQDESILSISSSNLSLSNSSSASIGKSRALKPVDPNLSGSSSSSGKRRRVKKGSSGSIHPNPPAHSNKLKRVDNMPKIDQISEILPRSMSHMNSGLDFDLPDLDMDSTGEMKAAHGFSESISAILPKESRSSKASEASERPLKLSKMKRPSKMELPVRNPSDVDMGNLSDDFIDNIISQYSSEQLLPPKGARELKHKKEEEAKPANSDSLSDGLIESVMKSKEEEEKEAAMKTEIMEDFVEEESIHKTSSSAANSTTDEVLDGLVDFEDDEHDGKKQRSKSGVSSIISDFVESSKSTGKPASRSASSMKSKDTLGSDFIDEPEVSGLIGDDFIDEPKSEIADVLSSEAVVEESKATGMGDDFIDESKSQAAEVFSSEGVVAESLSKLTGIGDDFVDESNSQIADVLSSDGFVDESKSKVIDDDFVDESKSKSHSAEVFSSEAIVDEPQSKLTGIDDDFVDESKSASQLAEVFSSEAVVDDVQSKITGIGDDFLDESKSKSQTAEVFSSDAVVDEPQSRMTAMDDDFVDESKSQIADVFSSDGFVDESTPRVAGHDDKSQAQADAMSSDVLVEEPESRMTGISDDFVNESKSRVDVSSSEIVVDEPQSKLTAMDDDFVDESKSQIADVFSSEGFVDESKSKTTGLGDDFVNESKSDIADVLSSDIMVAEPQSSMSAPIERGSNPDVADVFSSGFIEESKADKSKSNNTVSVVSDFINDESIVSHSKVKGDSSGIAAESFDENVDSQIQVFSDHSSRDVSKQHKSVASNASGNDKSDTLGFIEAFSELDSKDGEVLSEKIGDVNSKSELLQSDFDQTSTLKNDLEASSIIQVETGLSADDFVEDSVLPKESKKSIGADDFIDEIKSESVIQVQHDSDVNADVISEDIDDFAGDTTEIGKSSLPADDFAVETMSKIESDFTESKSAGKSSNGRVSVLGDSDFIKSHASDIVVDEPSVKTGSGVGASDFIDDIETSKLGSKSGEAEEFGSDGDVIVDEPSRPQTASRSRLLSSEVLEELSSQTMSRENSGLSSARDKNESGHVEELDDIDFIDDAPSKTVESDDFIESKSQAIEKQTTGFGSDFISGSPSKQKETISQDFLSGTGPSRSSPSHQRKEQSRKEQRRPSYVEFSDIEDQIEKRIESITASKRKSLRFCSNVASLDVKPEAPPEKEPPAAPPKQKKPEKRRRRKKHAILDIPKRTKPIPTLQVMPPQDSNVNYLNFIEEQKLKLRHIRQGTNASRQMRALRQSQVIAHNYEIADDNFDEVERALQLRSPLK